MTRTVRWHALRLAGLLSKMVGQQIRILPVGMVTVVLRTLWFVPHTEYSIARPADHEQLKHNSIGICRWPLTDLTTCLEFRHSILGGIAILWWIEEAGGMGVVCKAKELVL